MKSWQTYYTAPSSTAWHGRPDPGKDERLFQWIKTLAADKLATTQAGGFALIGFACDEGVRRNHGRPGAALGPQSLRAALCNICLQPNAIGPVYDLGDIVCSDGDLERAQAALAELVCLTRQAKLRPVVLGGGHETAWGHYQGLLAALPDKTHVGIVNFDAHFDLRPLTAEGLGHSGSPFRQMAMSCRAGGRTFDYTCLGVQPFANSASLFATAKELGVSYMLAEDMRGKGAAESVAAVVDRSQAIYVSLCLDVLAAAYAPGVSAIQPWGLAPHDLLSPLAALLNSGKVVGFDVVELAPAYDMQNLTARQGAYFIAEALRLWK